MIIPQMTIPDGMILFYVLAALWTIPWKAVALWKSGRNNQLVWFIVLMLVNTLGILEILYIFCFQDKKRRKK